MPFWQELALLLGIALVLAIAIKALFLQAFYIPSGSMNDTLVFNDRILVQKVSYWGSASPERGDIVVFEDPGDWLDGSRGPEARTVFSKTLEVFGLFPTGGHLVKRVIGVGGDSEVLRREGPGHRERHPAPREELPRTGEKPSLITFEQKVPGRYLWVMGDNRSAVGRQPGPPRRPGWRLRARGERRRQGLLGRLAARPREDDHAAPRRSRRWRPRERAPPRPDRAPRRRRAAAPAGSIPSRGCRRGRPRAPAGPVRSAWSLATVVPGSRAPRPARLQAAHRARPGSAGPTRPPPGAGLVGRVTPAAEECDRFGIIAALRLRRAPGHRRLAQARRRPARRPRLPPRPTQLPFDALVPPRRPLASPVRTGSRAT